METIRISRLSGQEAKKNVQVEALVSSMEEAMTSNGKPYVKGVLSDRRDKVSFKVWDTTLADLTKKYGLPAGKAFVGCLSGNIDVYEGKNLPTGKKSYAVSFFMQDESKTLNDKQIDAIMKKIQTNLEQKLGAQLR